MAEPGDMIEIMRGTFNHWALYIGDGYVIHMTAVDGVSDIEILYATVGISASILAIVSKQKLKEVVSGDKWLVNNNLDKKYKTKSPDVILKEAELLVGQEVPYDLLNNNCEHFVTNLRYGIPQSRQVRDIVIPVAIGGLFASLGGSASSVGGSVHASHVNSRSGQPDDE